MKWVDDACTIPRFKVQENCGQGNNQHLLATQIGLAFKKVFYKSYFRILLIRLFTDTCLNLLEKNRSCPELNLIVERASQRKPDWYQHHN